jgi:hypothetical protein
MRQDKDFYIRGERILKNIFRKNYEILINLHIFDSCVNY